MLRKNEDFKKTWSFKVFDIDESARAEPHEEEAAKEYHGQRDAAIATTAAIVAS